MQREAELLVAAAPAADTGHPEKADVPRPGSGAAVLADAGLTLVLMFVVVTAIIRALGPQSPVEGQSVWLKLAIVGALVGVTLIFLIRSP